VAGSAGKGKRVGDRIILCAGCDADGAAGLLERLRRRGLAVETTDCMNVCARPMTVAFRAPGKAAHLFAGVNPLTQGDEVAAFAGLYALAMDGIVADARACGQLRHCLIGRIPG